MKLHLGCGDKYIIGYVHIDIFDGEHIDYQKDIRDLGFLKNGSVDEIYACHVLEHFGRHEVREVLTEWVRVLKPGGYIRLAVPDFEASVKHYNEYKDVNVLMGLIVGGQRDEYDFHKSVFDFGSLKLLMEQCGLGQVNRYDWRAVEHSDVDDYAQSYLPHMDKESGLLMSLNVVAQKL